MQLYRGFNLTLQIDDSQKFMGVSESEIENYSRKIAEQRKKLKEKMESRLTTNLNSDGSIDGSKLSDEWFPNLKADIFISHSHKDLKKVKRIAVWLEKNMNLSAFIDSSVWGSADELLKEIDDRYSVLKYDDRGKPITYNYGVRNYTTAHVHMMLSTALMEMIDSTECILFINTPKSIKLTDYQERKTKSPWIYNELKITDIVQKKMPKRLLLKNYKDILSSERTFKNYSVPEIDYDVDKEISKLYHLSRDDLYNWDQLYNNINNGGQLHSLDVLYLKHPLNRK